MITQDQQAVVELLGSPGTYGVSAVYRIDTHSAIVFLAGTRAYKLKRAVRFDYLDFSTVERRRHFCEAEVRLNRRTAPTLYRGVIPITREPDGRLALGGTGTPVDWVVEMNRFPQAAIFDQLAAAGRLDLELMPPLGAAIARFHAGAERRTDHGGREGMAWVIDGNAGGFAQYGAGVLDSSLAAQVTAASHAELGRHAALLDARRRAGFVRQCHGDLHLRNIVLLNEGPTLFDGVEFDDRISCIDVLYDLAFLLMDLWRRQLPRHANAVWNAYLGETEDFGGLPLMPLFHACRAAVRAKTSATAAAFQEDPARRQEQQQLAREYLRMADTLLRPPPPCLIAIGGLSGTGKSTLALSLAPSAGRMPGAVVHRSDETRKRLCGVPPLQRLGPEGYSPEMSRRVYATLAERAGLTLRGGHTAIVDAVYARESDRQAIQEVAARLGVPFVGLWLEAPEPMLIERVTGRKADASDADAEVIRKQQAAGVGTVDWYRLDASAPADQVQKHAIALLQQELGEAFIHKDSNEPDRHPDPVPSARP